MLERRDFTKPMSQRLTSLSLWSCHKDEHMIHQAVSLKLATKIFTNKVGAHSKTQLEASNVTKKLYTTMMRFKDDLFV
jgi:hypothetical protein